MGIPGPESLRFNICIETFMLRIDYGTAVEMKFLCQSQTFLSTSFEIRRTFLIIVRIFLSFYLKRRTVLLFFSNLGTKFVKIIEPFKVIAGFSLIGKMSRGNHKLISNCKSTFFLLLDVKNLRENELQFGLISAENI